jgi:hypothetical protein
VIPAVKLTCAIVLFAVALLQQGPSPAPRTTPSPEIASREATDRDKKDTNSKGETPNQSPSATQRASSPKAADKDTSPVTSKNEDQSVRVVSVPPITVNGSKTEFVGLIATVVLALVGIGGIIVAICSLRVIKDQTVATKIAAEATRASAGAIQRQIEIMERQIRATEIAANAARKSAEISEMGLKLAERADVLLNAVGLTTNIPGISSNNPINPFSQVDMEFKNFGRTRAENVRCLIGLIIPGVPDSVPPQEPFVLGPGGTQRVKFQTFKETLTQETFEQIAKGAISLRFAGQVIYDDIFGESHTFYCSGILDPRTGTFILGKNDPRKTQTKEQNPN